MLPKLTGDISSVTSLIKIKMLMVEKNNNGKLIF